MQMDQDRIFIVRLYFPRVQQASILTEQALPVI